MDFIKGVFIFLIGLICGILLLYVSYLGVEWPSGGDLRGLGVSPGDFLTEDDVLIYDDFILVKVSGASISRYAESGSMRPVIDSTANGIRVAVLNEDEISVGDIITYERDSRLIVHRVVVKDYDSEGVYFIMKGDNLVYNDVKVRFSDIRFKTVGILY